MKRVNTSLDWDISILEKHCPASLIGVDEVGRGAWAGPLVACGVRTDATNLVVLHDRVRDSKATTPKQREALFDDLCLLPHAIAMRSVHQLAQLGLDECNWEVFAECAQALSQSSDCLHGAAVVLDGDCAPLNHYIACYCTPKAESLSATVAAASIIAKVTRDRWMIELGKAFPQYGFDKHKGYGTPQHAAAIKAYGVIPGVHRLDFIPRGLF